MIVNCYDSTGLLVWVTVFLVAARELSFFLSKPFILMPFLALFTMSSEDQVCTGNSSWMVAVGEFAL